MTTLCLLLFCALPAYADQVKSGNADLDLSAAEIQQLADKANRGDGDAAWQLFLCYDLARSDTANGNLWLNRAAVLQNPNAERQIAEEIKNRNAPFSAYGATKQEAYLRVLKPATRTDGQACYELAESYADGIILPVNLVLARSYLEQGAKLGDRMCWELLSDYYHAGKGGPRDDASAYYWIALETRCVAPDSIGGEKSWATREEIARHLSLSEMRNQWRRIDKYINQVRTGKITVYETPFGKGTYYPDDSAKDMAHADQREAEHRQAMTSRG